MTLESAANNAIAYMSIPTLMEHCLRELNRYQHGEPSNDQYGLELFYRAQRQRDPLAWEVIQQCFSGTMLRWMYSHPKRKFACRIDSEENYVAQAFTRFWQATTVNQEIEFKTLAAALRYLHMSLHGAIMDTLRAYSRPRETPLSEYDEASEPLAGEGNDGRELWEAIRSLLSHEREQRVAYLLFHCGLKPREIVQFCPQEFSDVQEIYRLRRSIFERLLRHADHLRWRLSDGLKGTRGSSE